MSDTKRSIERSPQDGPLEVSRVRDETGTPGPPEILIQATSGMKKQQVIVCTEWQARRLLGMLSILLKLPLTAKAQSQIEMG